MKKKNRRAALGLTFWFSLIVFIENLIAVGISTASVTIINFLNKGGIQIDSEILVLLFSVVIGGVLSFATIKIFLAPIRKLNANISKVATGDFKIRIEGKSKIKEIDNMYFNFNKMVEELETMEIIQSDFVSNVSHEFKTPISAIEGYSMLLQGCENKEEQDKYVQKILFNLERLSNLVGNILLLAKLDNQKIEPKYCEFNLSEQIRQSILSFEIQWTEKNIEFEVDLAEQNYYGTEELMIHVWNNLLGNAIKFSNNDGKIIINLTKNDDEIVFSITDFGPGISDDKIERVFDRFYQIESDKSSSGNGLGLSLAKKIVEINGGEISVKNNDCGGCTFTVVLR